MYQKIPTVFKNKYMLTLIVFLIWMLFFDAHNIVSRISGYSQLSEAKAKRKYYIKEIEANKKDMEELMTNQKTLEKFAREKYKMKKDDEDLFIIVVED